MFLGRGYFCVVPSQNREKMQTLLYYIVGVGKEGRTKIGPSNYILYTGYDLV